MEKWQVAVMCSEMAGGGNNMAETNWEWLSSWGPAPAAAGGALC